jgi:hypothetical protein
VVDLSDRSYCTRMPNSTRAVVLCRAQICGHPKPAGQLCAKKQGGTLTSRKSMQNKNGLVNSTSSRIPIQDKSPAGGSDTSFDAGEAILKTSDTSFDASEAVRPLPDAPPPRQMEDAVAQRPAVPAGDRR